jgi:hypothetical protein
MTSWSTSGLYGFTWDVNYEVTDMEQIRNTYPLSGFRILLASYAEALRNAEPVDPKTFVVRYASDRFGLSESEGELLWEILTIPPELIVNGKPATSASIGEMMVPVREAIIKMNRLKPLYHKDEFEHFRLMLDLRDHYLRFKEAESRFNSADFSEADKDDLARDLEGLIRETKQLDRRFARLQEGFLHESEIAQQNMIRNRKLMLLHRRLTGNRTM